MSCVDRNQIIGCASADAITEWGLCLDCLISKSEKLSMNLRKLERKLERDLTASSPNSGIGSLLSEYFNEGSMLIQCSSSYIDRK